MEAKKQTRLPPFHRNLVRAVRRDYVQHADPSTIAFARAYALGYSFETIPAIAKLFASSILFGRASKRDWTTLRRRLASILKNGFGRHGLALFFGVALGGSKWLERIFIRILASTTLRRKIRAAPSSNPEKSKLADYEHLSALRTWSTFLATLLATGTAFELQFRMKRGPERAINALPLVNIASGNHPPFIRGRYESTTLDFTLFLLVRALDTGLRAGDAAGALNRLPLVGLLAEQGDTLLFVACSWLITWHWIYKPWLLPPSYDSWIHSFAHIDKRLFELLRYVRQGDWIYGQIPSSIAAKEVGPGLCTALGRQAELGMPDRISAFPCDVVHGRLGNTASCGANLLKRWITAWSEAMRLYLPVHLLPLLLFSRNRLSRTPIAAVQHSLLGAARSAAFLATFVAGIWGGICAGRTVIGPRLISNQQLWDGGLAMLFGTFLSGWSVLLENKRRRIEMALFVAPRALYTVIDKLVPIHLLSKRHGHKLAKEIERAVFALSAAVIITSSVHKPTITRGVVRSIARLLVGNWGGLAVTGKS